MDKHEFNIKVDQIKKMVSKGDFETAMKIADTIDWRRVRNANLLSMISSVYEKNAEYQEAKDILLIAFERAPIGKRLLYKLTQLALKEGDIGEAESYYREFCDLAGDDSRQDILRYLILKAKGAPIEQLIHSLESYTSIELDEKWLYELADLYHQAGNEDACVKTCDKIMLMFGLGQYVDKAMELKLQYAPLTKYQMDLVENRDKYEEKLRQVEQNGVSAVSSSEEISKEEEEMAAAARRGQVAAMEVKTAARQAPVPAVPVAPSYSEAASQPPMAEVAAAPVPVPVPAPVPQPAPPVYAEVSQPSPSYGSEAVPSADEGSAGQAREEEMVSNIAASFAAATTETSGACVSPEERLEVSMKEAEVEASLAEEMSKLSKDSFTQEPVREKTRVLQNVKDLKKAGEPTEKTKVLDEIRHIQPTKPAEEPEKAEVPKHIMVEAREPEKGLEIAIETLKKAHQIFACKRPVAKISGEKLNQKGILASASKLAGKDLIVENAGDLCDAMLEELDKLLSEDKSGSQVVLVDNPRQLEGIRRISPSLADKFHVVASVEEAEKMFAQGAERKPVRQAAPKTDTITLRQPISERETAASRQPNSQREAAASGQPISQREAAATGQPISQREPAASGQPVSQRGMAASGQPASQGGSGISQQQTSQRGPGAVQQPVSQRGSGAVQQPVSQRGSGAAQQSASQREAVRPSAAQQNTTTINSSLSQREMVTPHPSSVQREQALAGQTAQQREAAPIPSAASQRNASVRPAPAQRENLQKNSSVSASTSSGNIVQLRNASAAPVNERGMAEQGGNRVDDPEDGRVMDIDEFAQYCCHYASQIDCNISGKSMLALYERIEIMEEDGIALTKIAAEDLIEEAADRAEKPSLGKRIAGLFSSKYDKEGLLILKEEHFIP